MDGGVGLKLSQENEENEGSEEQPPRLAPATAIAMTRRMINPSLRPTATIPARTLGASAPLRNKAGFHG